MPAKKTTKNTAANAKTTAEDTATKAADDAKSAFDSIIENVSEAFEGVAGRTEDALETAVRYGRDASFAYIGAGFVVSDRISQGKFELMDYQAFIDEAKAKGEARVTEVQEFFEPISERFEAQLPAPVRDAIVDGRERVRELLKV